MKYRRRPTPTLYLVIALASVIFAGMHPEAAVVPESEAVTLAVAWADASE